MYQRPPPILGEEEGKEAIKWIKYSRLFHELTCPSIELNTSMLSVFLYTYPYFTNGLKLLENFVYHLEHAKVAELHGLRYYATGIYFKKFLIFLRVRIRTILAMWVQPLYSWQITEDKTLFRKMEKVISGKLTHGEKAGSDVLLCKLIC